MVAPTDVNFVDNTTPVISAAWLNGISDWVNPAYSSGTFVFNGATVTFAGTNGTTITFPSTTGTLAKAGANSDITSLSALTEPTGFRNKVINGDMRIAQRGTTYAITTSVTYGSLDRWFAIQTSSATATLSQVAGTDGFYSMAKLSRNVGATTTTAIQMGQTFESTNSVALQGKTVTLSFYAKAGTNFSAASSNINVQIMTGTGTDQSASSMISGTWTGYAAANSTITISTTLTKYSFTTTLAANITQAGINFYFSPVGTAGADDAVYITGVQLEVGSVATPFEQRPYGTELALCKRYGRALRSEQLGFAITGGQNVYGGAWVFDVEMRTTPTLSSGAYFTVSTGSAGTPGLYGATTQSTGIQNTGSAWTLNAQVSVTGFLSAEL